MFLYTSIIETDIGLMRIVINEKNRLLRIDFESAIKTELVYPEVEVETIKEDGSKCYFVEEQLREYFYGRRKNFDVEVEMYGTDFQLQVWSELKKIPFGQTISYGELARRIGNPKAVRAVGLANGKNPIPIIIPCHRVIGADGSLTGFAGGIENKRKLLELEGSIAPSLF